MQAGKLRFRCTLMRPEQVRGPSGGFVDTFVKDRDFWADIQAVSGRAWLAAAQGQSEVTTAIICRPINAPAYWRVVYGDTTYEIQAPLLDRPKDELRLMCKTVKPDG